jgi:ubiquinone/menaquinone biosynthesis C-methylase UbiE
MQEGRGLVFDRAAEEYDRARPSYPSSLVDTACDAAGLSRGSPVVEVGCGTGKLTVALAERQLRVEAIDPGNRLLEIARRRITGGSDVRFRVGRFEDVELPTGAFDAVFSSAAFHWVDPGVGWSKAARVLRSGGVLALLTHVGSGRDSDLKAGLREAWRRVVPEAASWPSRDAATIWKGVEERRGNISEVWSWLEGHDLARPEAATLFEDVELATVAEEQEVTAEEHVAFVRTTSAYLRLDTDGRRALEDRLSAVIAEAGGHYARTEYATLVMARVRAAS